MPTYLLYIHIYTLILSEGRPDSIRQLRHFCAVPPSPLPPPSFPLPFSKPVLRGRNYGCLKGDFQIKRTVSQPRPTSHCFVNETRTERAGVMSIFGTKKRCTLAKNATIYKFFVAFDTFAHLLVEISLLSHFSAVSMPPERCNSLPY